MSTAPGPNKRTPLYEEHLTLGARMTDFAGFDMPVQYEGIVQEHLAVRQRAGLFDLSHMGQIKVTGTGAADFLDWAFTNNIANLRPGQARYSPLCQPDGGIVDDVIVYKLDDGFLIIANAANVQKDVDWLQQLRAARHDGGTPVAADSVTIEDLSADRGILALQGPAAAKILGRLTDADLSNVRPFQFVEHAVADHSALISRTGYTGEDGFELYVETSAIKPLWRALLDAGKEDGIVPVGLGARDTLRLEMRFPLYGNDIDESTTPLEAGLDFTVKLDKPTFVGKQALQEQKAAGVPRKLVGFNMLQRGIPRHGYALFADGQQVGHVTSGTLSPSLGEPIGMGYVAAAYSEPGTELAVEIRGRRIPIQIASGRFVPA